MLGWCLCLLAGAADVALQASAESVASGSAGREHWPTPRGRVGSYGASPHEGPQNLSSALPAWTWHHPASRYHTILVGAALLDEASNVYIGAVDGVRKFSPDGHLLWTYEASSSIFAAPSLMDGCVYGSTFNGRFFSLSMETGREIWNVKVSPLIAMDATAVVAHKGAVFACVDVHHSLKGNARVVALNASDGRLLWEFWPDTAVTNFVAIFADDGTLVFQDREAVVYRLSPLTGALIWRAGRHDRGLSAQPPPVEAMPEAVPAPGTEKASQQRPQLPRRTGPPCPAFPVGNGTAITLQPANSSERTVRLWRRKDKPGGMVVMWFHKGSWTPLAWSRQRLQEPRAALMSGAPVAVGVVLLCYSGCCLGCCFCCWGCSCCRGKSSYLRHLRRPWLLLALLAALLAVLPGLRTATGEGAALALGESAEAILEDGGIILGFDGDFDANPFVGWRAVLEPGWAENEDWRVVDEAVACAFEWLPGLDPARVHAAGFSAGGVMAAKAGFMRPQYIASVAPVSGSLLPMEGEQWRTPPPRPDVRSRGFAAMLVVGGEVDLVQGQHLFDGGGARSSFKVSGQFTRDLLLGRGQLAFICDHGGGHQAMPRAIADRIHRFFKDHPFDVPSPYALQGLPADFDRSVCEEARGLGLPGGDWRYACCSASDGDLDPTPHHVSRAHLQLLKKSEGIPDSVIPYMAPERVSKDFFERMWAIYGRERPGKEPSAGENATATVHGIHDDDGCRAGSHRSTVGGTVVGPNGVVYAVSVEEDRTGRFFELPGCLHAYRLSDGRLLWQRGLPFRARVRPALARLRGLPGLTVVVPSGRDPHVTWKMAILGAIVSGAALGFLGAQLLGLARRCCLGGRCCMGRRTGQLTGLGAVVGLAVGVGIVACWEATNSEVWAFGAEAGELRWRFRAPPWERLAAAGDEEGVLTRMRLGRLRTDCMPSSWSSPTVDGEGTVYLGHMSGRLFAVRGDLDGDGLISGEEEVSSYAARSAFPHAGPSMAPGLLAAASCDELLVFRA